MTPTNLVFTLPGTEGNKSPLLLQEEKGRGTTMPLSLAIALHPSCEDSTIGTAISLLANMPALACPDVHLTLQDLSHLGGHNFAHLSSIASCVERKNMGLETSRIGE